MEFSINALWEGLCSACRAPLSGSGLFSLILPALLAGLLLSGILSYFGSHIIRRGIIFVDLALAQVVALGFGLGELLRLEHGSPQAWGLALGLAVLAALGFAALRKLRSLVNIEAFIGFVYVLATALTFMVLAKSPHGLEEIEQLLNGNILYVCGPDLLKTFLLFSGVGIFHWIFREKFYAENLSLGWDFLFFLSFALVVTASVVLGGVYLTFSYLIVPALTGSLFSKQPGKSLAIGWGLGVLATLLGGIISYKWDLPPSPSIITVLGLGFLLALFGKLLGGKPKADGN